MNDPGMVDVWGDPVKVKTTPAGNRVRVALGTGCGRDQLERDDVWEMRVTHPDDDYRMVTCWTVHPDHDPAQLAAMRADAELFWAEREARLMWNHDLEVAGTVLPDRAHAFNAPLPAEYRP